MQNFNEEFMVEKLLENFERQFIQCDESEVYEKLKTCCNDQKRKDLMVTIQAKRLITNVERNSVSEEKLISNLEKLEIIRTRKKIDIRLKIVVTHLMVDILTNHIDFYNPACDYIKKIKNRSILKRLINGDSIEIPITKLHNKWKNIPIIKIYLTVIPEALNMVEGIFKAEVIDPILANKVVIIYSVLS